MAGIFAAFISALFEPTDIIEVRRLPSKQSDWYTAKQLCEFHVVPKAWEGQNIYIGANPRTRIGGRDTASVKLARCVFADFDGIDLGEAKRRIIDAELPKPTALTLSGGGVHAYWRLTQSTTDFAEWERIQRGIIKALGSDPVIHDPPRIMRLPGTHNIKRDKPATVAELFDADYSDLCFPRAELPSVQQGGGAVGGGPVLGGMVMAGLRVEPQRGTSGLSRNTLHFLNFGAGKGERNKSCFAAACDYAGCQISMEVAEHDLLNACAKNGLYEPGDFDESQVVDSIRSAYRKPRSSARPARVVTAATTTNDDDASEPHGVDSSRFCFSNVIDRWREEVKRRRNPETGKMEAKGESTPYTVYKPIEAIAGEITGLTNGWPKLVGGAPFIIDGAGLNAVPQFLPQPQDLFGWLHREADVNWHEGKCEDENTKAPRTPVTKPELLAAIKQGAGNVERYRLVTAYPHEPRMSGIYYVPLDLPPATGETLHEFLSAFNPETEHDRGLMLACLMTMFWGGPPGTRPMFVLSSTSGVGAGKTSTAIALADVAGGHCALDYAESWTDLTKQMMSSEQWAARNILFDNVKGKFGGSALEAAVSSKELSGWRNYVGRISRPNDAVILVTFNLPELTRDMAERAVVIKIGKPRHEKSFVAWASSFVQQHRLQLIADILSILKAPPSVKISPENTDRWQAWQREILGRIPDGDALAATICGRRPAVDSDREDAGAICGLLVSLAERTGSGGVTTYAIHDAVRTAGLWKDNAASSDGHNRQMCIGFVRRVLSGRGVIEPMMGDSGEQMRKVVRDKANTPLPGRSPVWSIDIEAAKLVDGGDDPDVDLPI